MINSLEDDIYNIIKFLNQNEIFDSKIEGFMLNDLGYEIINQGSYAKIYQLSGNRNWVIKVSENDPAYDAYVRFVNAVKNPHFPVVTNIFSKTQNNIYVIEYLKPFSKDKEFAYQIQSCFYYATQEKIGANTSKMQKYALEVWDELNTTHPVLISAIRSIVKSFKNSQLDVYENNIMERPDGTIVLSDPVAPFEINTEEPF